MFNLKWKDFKAKKRNLVVDKNLRRVINTRVK